MGWRLIMNGSASKPSDLSNFEFEILAAAEAHPHWVVIDMRTIRREQKGGGPRTTKGSVRWFFDNHPKDALRIAASYGVKLANNIH